MNTTPASLISESVLEGRTTGTKADESVEMQSMISETKTGETTTGNVDTEGPTKELLVHNDKERHRLELASLFNGAQPMTSTTITSHRKRTKKKERRYQSFP